MSSQTSTVTEKAISQNGNAQNDPPPAAPPSSQIDKLVIANTTLAVWLIFLAIGGGILALYYARIGYLPDVEWKASLVYLFIGSIVGGAIGLLLTLSLLIPGVVWSQFILLDPCVDFALHSPVSGKQADEEPCIRTVVRYLGLPFLIFLLVSHLFLLTGKEPYWVLAALTLGLTFWWMRRSFRAMVKKTCAGETAAHAFKYAAWFTLSVLLSQVTMYVIYWLSGSPGARFWQTGDTENLGVFAVLTLLCTAGVWISNHAVAVLYRQQFRGAIAAALLAAGLLLFTADHFSHLSVKLMNHYGIGDNQAYDVIVSDKGQGLVDTLGLKPCSKNLLCKVQILSKIGDKYYLKIGDTEYVTLPKEDVIATRQVKD